MNKKEEYYYFDTHIIIPKARKRGLSYPLMEEIIKVIKKNNLKSFLICDDDLINYYLKFEWKLLNNKDFEVKDHKFSTNGMIFNENTSEKSLLNNLYIFFNLTGFFLFLIIFIIGLIIIL